MPTNMIVVAAVASVVMAVAIALMLRRAAPASLLGSIGVAVLAVAVSAALALALRASVPVSVAVATGAAPVAVLVLGLLAREERARRAPLVAVTLWGLVVVPLGIVVPQAIVAACPPQACVVEDFGGALPFAVGVGAFLFVPSAAVPTLRRVALPERRRTASDALVLLVWAAFAVWLTALELDVDGYTPRIALAALVSPAVAALGWALTDRIRGLDASPLRGLSLGLVAGMVAALPSVGSVTTPWFALIGAIAGIAGALAHDARALRASPPTTRVAVAAIVVGMIGLIAPGIVGTTLGFVFAARIDVLGSQVAAAVGVAIVAIAVSVPAAVLLRRRARR